MTRGEGAVVQLAVLAGVEPRQAVADGYTRWRLYEESLRHLDRRSLVLEAVRTEDDGPLAAATVVQALERASDAERATWVGALPVGKERDFAARRAREFAQLAEIMGGDGAAAREEDVRDWSQWLQLRLAEQVTSKRVLELLAEHGMTRRIRHLAGRRFATG
jgi:hypothetical protein